MKVKKIYVRFPIFSEGNHCLCGCDSSHVAGLTPRGTVSFRTTRQRLVDLKSLETDTNLVHYKL